MLFRSPDGNYRATLSASGISDTSGNAMTGNPPRLDFFVLTGDANHDRSINALDFNILASNYGQSHARFSRGDFNYDVDVTSLDFDLLAAKFGTSLAAAASTQSPLANAMRDLFSGKSNSIKAGIIDL